MTGDFKLPMVQHFETTNGRWRVRAGKMTMSITQARDLALELYASAHKAQQRMDELVEPVEPDSTADHLIADLDPAGVVGNQP